MGTRIAFCATALLALTVEVSAQQTPAAQPDNGGVAPSNAPKLPPIKVITTPPKSRPRANNKPVVARGQNAGGSQASVDGTAGQNGGAAPTALAPQVSALNAARENILPKIGTNTYELNRQAIEALPQGDNASLDKVLLQTPGVYQDSAASGSLHIRNEHANLQYRINGIQLPEGVAGFSQVLDTSLIGNMTVVTGALPAQYGLRTAGLVDIQTRSGALEPSGQIGVYGGSNGTFSSNIQYGGVSGNTEYFFTGRFLESDLGIENPTSSSNAIHDHTQQEKFFSYVSTVQPNNSRWTLITGGSVGHYQIPSNPGQQTIDQQGLVSTLPTPLNGITFDSAKTNEQQLEQNYFGVLAFQQTVGNVDYQISSFTRYSSVHFTPDLFNDLAFNGIASDVSRHSFLSGVQADGAWRVSANNTLRAGVVVSGEQTYVTNASTTITSDTNELTNITDRNSKTGWLAGIYLQDELKLTQNLKLNTGLRFDQMWQYVDANQLSPRVSLVYKPFDGTVLHAGYARYFTPPSQAVGAPANFGLFDKTIAASEVTPNTVPGLVINPSLPERSHYFDVGVTQKLAPGLEVGVDAYYKIARDLIDDGQFGAAYVLTAFNYDKGENEGVELKVRYTKEGLMVYGNLAWARQVASNFVSNQYLQGLDDYKFALTNFVATDHSQTVSASAGASYRFWEGTRASVDMIYGSGLRSGDHNSDHLPGYTQFNLGLSHEFTLSDWKPFTLRFDVVNLFDHVYEIRDGSGIGVFAPQFGPRRGYFVGFSQKF